MPDSIQVTWIVNKLLTRMPRWINWSQAKSACQLSLTPFQLIRAYYLVNLFLVLLLCVSSIFDWQVVCCPDRLLMSSSVTCFSFYKVECVATGRFGSTRSDPNQPIREPFWSDPLATPLRPGNREIVENATAGPWEPYSKNLTLEWKNQNFPEIFFTAFASPEITETLSMLYLKEFI